MMRAAGLLIFLAVLAAGWLVNDMQRYLETPLHIGDDGAIVVIAPGTNLKKVARQLASRQILTKPRYLTLYARYNKLAQRIQAGEYAVQPGTTPRGLLDQFVAGDIIEYQLTLIEGWTFKDVRKYLASQETLGQTVIGLSDEELMTRLGYSGEHPEGRFFPDTYRYHRGEQDTDILRRAHAAMNVQLEAAWALHTRDSPVKTPYEALVLASIVEKETGRGEERAQIAGVFLRRLRRGMRLQTDPTVIYGMGERYKGNIKRRHLAEKTAYNTYQIDGLPPTPIAMPGAQALRAVMQPDDSKTLYFVARGDGTHYFSATLKEHNAAVRKYQLRRSQ